MRISTKNILLLAFCLFLQEQTAVQASPAAKSSGHAPLLNQKPPAKMTPQGGIMQDVASMESKFLNRDYAQDPLDKRLQRLELLFFGATQTGSPFERLQQLQASAFARPRSIKSTASDTDQAESIKGLEERVLKKTYPQEAPAARLTRLEQRVFGKPSPSIAINDRIERLRKTLGIADTPPIAQYQGPGDFGDTMIIPFGGGLDGDTSMQLNKQLNEMMRQMRKQMRSLPNNMPQGREMMPFPSPFGDGLPLPGRSQDNRLPPYLDPNSI